MAENDVLLEANGLKIEYPTSKGANHAVNGVDLTVNKGEIVGIVGESGSGKSSVALAMMNLVRHPGRITEGEILLEGRDLRRMGDKELRKIRGKDISLVVQNPKASLNPMLKIGPQIVNVIRAHEDLDKDAARARAEEMLRVVGINDPQRRLEAFPHQLSGGMAQRVLIAMALACKPKVLLADEPTSGLDVTIQAQILDDFASAVETTGSSALLVTQDLGIVANYCDRVMVMYGGQVVESASVDELFKNPRHPCTIGLLSVHGASKENRLRHGRLSLSVMPSGCLVEPRCPRSDGTTCREESQVLAETDSGHFVRCHRWDVDVATEPAQTSESASFT